MTSRPGPEGVPPAFRGRAPAAASFIGLNDGQVLKIATAAFTAAQALPVGSAARARQWARFDDAMGELAGRGLRHVLAKLRERDEAARAPGDGPA
jgi:hypothetical protein